ncbi:hypothetical protein TNCV_2003851 [Trichonephila clavipes]|nr:hypothetical protein TNCV_2003851 [Trichonephila clavipes]
MRGGGGVSTKGIKNSKKLGELHRNGIRKFEKFAAMKENGKKLKTPNTLKKKRSLPIADRSRKSERIEEMVIPGVLPPAFDLQKGVNEYSVHPHQRSFIPIFSPSF